MKVVVGCDVNGHFHVFRIKNRKEIFEFIQENFNNREFINLNYNNNFSYIKLSHEEWIHFINEFANKGFLEIIDFA